MRINGQDFGQSHLLRITRFENEILLVATPKDNDQEEIVIGRSNGLTEGFLKFNLLPVGNLPAVPLKSDPWATFTFLTRAASSPSLKNPPLMT